MLSPLAVATWISICTPWAEPRLLAALVTAGSGGEPFMINAGTDQAYIGKSQADAIRYFRQLKPAGEVYLGLTQVPLSKLTALGIHPETALETCGNLEIGYHLFNTAHEQAEKSEKSPWKTTSVAYSIYRTGQIVVDSPFGKKATDYLMKSEVIHPASINSMLRHSIMAEWSAGIASRQASRHTRPRLAPLLESAAIVEWARNHY
jgi:hypothetical protein